MHVKGYHLLFIDLNIMIHFIALRRDVKAQAKKIKMSTYKEGFF